jgi:LysM repeat protein
MHGKTYGKKQKPTLMPLVALGGLSLAVTLPALSSTVHAAPRVTYATVTVHRGDTLWSIAERKAAPASDIQSTVDQIIAVNRLPSAGLTIGQKLRVPE